ncbi:hypothetical protein [Candidatus Contendibacter odensensis]|uniref:Uncharacterized protein n=1 Tax=Candidatus Contendobacter odensis Run_B_J11 TaxID=1400861 RepID=A0A7U7GEW3_9GAMM|nr:hypothetical protein [Candidatus Contendobacter odensis]CDH46989.1 hypothetical protein BN874_690039 [Candidatus Contendobacter odensis Run_B_J11]
MGNLNEKYARVKRLQDLIQRGKMLCLPTLPQIEALAWHLAVELEQALKELDEAQSQLDEVTA